MGTYLESLWRKKALIVFSLVWLGAIGSGYSLLVRYENTPGLSAPPPSVWPSGSKIQLSKIQPTLIMLVHPRCPCSRASLEELSRLLTVCKGKVTAKVIFYKPAGGGAEWSESRLWKQAQAIPGLDVIEDTGGAEVLRFHAATSGQTLLYAPDGKLLFSGGITASRGHSGDNPGEDSIKAILYGKSGALAKTPVFGCSLHDRNFKKVKGFKFGS